MALGNYPSYLKPFVFSWPTGQLYCFLAAKRAAVADMTTGVSLGESISAHDLLTLQEVDDVDDLPSRAPLMILIARPPADGSIPQSLIETMKALDQAGFKKLHILTHSMGARVLMAAIPQLTGLVQKSRSVSVSAAALSLMMSLALAVFWNDANYTTADLTVRLFHYFHKVR